MEKAALMLPVCGDALTLEPGAIRGVHLPVALPAPGPPVQRPAARPGPPYWFGDISDGEELGW